MSHSPIALFAASCFFVSTLSGSARAQDDMNAPPIAWLNTGAVPLAQFDAQKHPTSIALTIPAALVAALPEKRSEAVYLMSDAGFVQSANLQWHPMGHEPAHVYDVPHFDVHFYTITEAVRQSIVPGAAAGAVVPKDEYLPPNSLLVPGFVPGMGMHDVQKSQPEMSGGPFTVSPLIGYWNGEIAFFEVMFSKDWLQSKHSVVADFPQPVAVKERGYYPTKYRVSYDGAQDAYTVALTDFISR